MISALITRQLRLLTLPAFCVLVAACTSAPVENASNDTTTSVDNTGTSNSASVTADSVGRNKAIVSYRNYLEKFPDSPRYDSVSRRLADLLVEQAADVELAAATQPGGSTRLAAQARQLYTEAANYYEYLLTKDPQGPERTALLYPLARAYEQSGQTQRSLATIDLLLEQEVTADQRLYADTRFRQGELYFSQGKYTEAGSSYLAVVDAGPSMPAYEASLYKLGWSLFKQERYQEALPVLCAFLDRKLPDDSTADGANSALGTADREQVIDVLRVISRSFAQLGGADAITHYFSNNVRSNYEQRIYLALADWYVEQEQVTEATHTWLTLAQRQPLDATAPQLTIRAIDLYRDAGFQRRERELQAQFVIRYGRDSDFWEVHSWQDFPAVQESLQLSLQQLAHSAHAEADRTGDPAQVDAAANWYQQYLATTTDETTAAKMNMQLAALLYEHQHYSQAAQEYDKAAWHYGPHAQSADAALGMQRAVGKLRAQAAAVDQPALAQREISGIQRFIVHYPQNPVAPALLAQGGTMLLEQQHYTHAIELGVNVTEQPSASPELRQVGWSLRAQGMYAIQDYQGAEAAYSAALHLAGETDERRPALQAGLASAIYKQAAQASTDGDHATAAQQYQQAAELTPDASIRSRAIYDRATALLTLQTWPEAIALLEQFRHDYPDDPLQQEVSGKLAYAYERSAAYQQAADEYYRLGQDTRQDHELRRQALLQATALYDKEGDIGQVRKVAQDYLEQFPQPAASAVSVMRQLADLEFAAGNIHSGQNWLRSIIELDNRAEGAATRKPAAEATLELASYRRAAFDSIQLVDPVQDNLAQKIAAMKQALQGFEAAIAYGVTPVSFAANYYIATMYDGLSRALLASQRPATLSGEERAEYEALLIQQAAPFKQQAIDIYARIAQQKGNAENVWIEKSERQLNALQRAH